MRRNFSKFATNRSTCLPGTRSTHVPEKHGIRCIWLPVTRWTQTVPDLRLSRHHSSAQAPHSPAALRAARRAQRSLIGHHPRRPSPAAPAPRSLSVLRHAGSAAHDGQASRLTHPWCRVQHVVPEEVAQVAVVVVVFPVVVLRRGEHRSQWARLSRASTQIKHHKASIQPRLLSTSIQVTPGRA
jgi:hypothetical protein